MGIIKDYIAYGVPKTQRLKYSDSRTIGYEPIVQKPIPLTASEHNTRRPEVSLASRNIDDLARISTLLRQPPGLQFINNESLLYSAKDQRTSKDKIRQYSTQEDDGFSNLGSLFKSKLLSALRTVTGGIGQTAKTVASTLAQVPVNGTGTHFVKGFNGTSRQTYLSNLGVAPHTLVRQGKKVFPDNTIMNSGINNETVGGTKINPDDRLIGTSELTGLKDSQELLDFKTIEPNSVQSAAIFKRFQSFEAPSITVGNTNLTSGINNFFSDLGERANSVFKDFKQTLGGDIGKRIDRVDTEVGYDSTISDRVNMVNPYPGDVDENIVDLIKFRFNIIKPDDNMVLHFRAFLDSFDDSFNGDWNAWKYNGRAENFYTYKGFERSINIGFKIAAQTKPEMQPLYQKIVQLASTTAPTYNNEGVMRGSLVKVTVGDYLYDMPGFLSNVTYTWNTSYPWEINGQQLPHVLDCSVSFTPIHKFAPQTGYFHYISRPGSGEIFSEQPTGRASLPNVFGDWRDQIDTTVFGDDGKITAPDVPFDKLLQPREPRPGEKGYKRHVRKTYRDMKKRGLKVDRKGLRSVLRARTGG